MIVLKWVLIFVLGVLCVVTGLFIWNYVFGVRLQDKLFKQMAGWLEDDDEDTATKDGEASTCTTQTSKKSTSKA